jgi:hypothetical protein
MSLPPYPRKGQAVHQWARALCDYVRAGQINSVLGGRLTGSGNGKTLVIEGGASSRSTKAGNNTTPFFPRLKVGDDSLELSFNPGRLIEMNPKEGENAVRIWLPTVEDTPMDAKPRPTISAETDQWAYLYYETDSTGAIKEDPAPSIKVEDPNKESKHYTPAPPDEGVEDGEDGEYWVPIAKVTTVDDRPKVTSVVQSDVVHAPYLWAPRNGEGDGESIAPKFDGGQRGYVFPKIRGANVIKVEKEEESLVVSLDVTSSAHIRYYDVLITLDNESSGGIKVARSSSPNLQLWIFRGLVYLSEPEGYDGTDNPYDIYSALPNEIPV